MTALWQVVVLAVFLLLAWAAYGQEAAPPPRTPAAQPAALPDFRAKVSGVDDGHSLIVQSGGRPQRIRLHGIESPRPGQECAGQSKAFLAELAYGREVLVKPRGRGEDGRVDADVLLPDGRRLADELLRAGMAWALRRPDLDPQLASAEADARGNRCGLWRQENPVPPWEYRPATTTGAVTGPSADTIKVAPPPPDPNAPKNDAQNNPQPFSVDVFVAPPFHRK